MEISYDVEQKKKIHTFLMMAEIIIISCLEVEELKIESTWIVIDFNNGIGGQAEPVRIEMFCSLKSITYYKMKEKEKTYFIRAGGYSCFGSINVFQLKEGWTFHFG